MEWKAEDIFKIVAGSGAFTLISTIIAKSMGWIRFGKADKVRIQKVQSETVLDIATVLQKKITDESKVADTALQWNINLATQLEKEKVMNDKKQTEIDRLHDIINKMKYDFEGRVQKLREDFESSMKNLEAEFEKSRKRFVAEREENVAEIQRLKRQINGE